MSARQLAGVVRAITSGADPRLRAALAGFPVAGLTGTLGARYADASTARGAGLVRAKTGTLNTVTALSGYVVDADGRLLVFSFIGNGLTPAPPTRRPWTAAASALARLRLPLEAGGNAGVAASWRRWVRGSAGVGTGPHTTAADGPQRCCPQGQGRWR